MRSLRADGQRENSDVATLQEAVALAHEAVGEGGVVVLSPGCSSFDMFESYAARGRRFCELAAERA